MPKTPRRTPQPRRGPWRLVPPARPALAAAILISGSNRRAVARVAGLNPDTIQRAILGRVDPLPETQQRIAEALGITDVDALFARRDLTAADAVERLAS